MNNANKPFSQSCENNQAPILEKLHGLLGDAGQLLEVGSGTGQHAVYFAAQLPYLIWQTSDQSEYHAGIKLWLAEARLVNVRSPILLDVRNFEWNAVQYDAVFTANTLHIMAEAAAQQFVGRVSAALKPGGQFIAYGPFNYEGRYTSQSNERFDGWLKQQNSQSGIRDFERLNQCAAEGGMRLDHDFAMPANNRLLVWRKTALSQEHQK